MPDKNSGMEFARISIDYMTACKSEKRLAVESPEMQRIIDVSRALSAHLGHDATLSEVTAGDVAGFADSQRKYGGKPKRMPGSVVQVGQPLPEAEVQKRLAIASGFFDYAVEVGAIAKNPFAATTPDAPPSS